MKILRAADYRRSLWKNGGGETREIAVFPEGAGMADFDWRISVALVASDGPFSLFPGIARTLTILSGGPMALSLEGQPILILDPHTAPLAFAADIAASARLSGPPVLDLNVMTRRSVFTHEVHVIPLDDHERTLETGRIRAIFCMEGALHIQSSQKEAKLETHDCCVLAPGDGMAVMRGEGKAATIMIHPVKR